MGRSSKKSNIHFPIERFFSDKVGGETNHFHLSVVEYTENTFLEKENPTIEQCLKYMKTPYMTWIQVNGVKPEMVVDIGKHFKLHTLILEDILNTNQRAKLDVYQDQVFIVMRYLKYEDHNDILKDEQISLVFTPNYLISFLESHEKIFDPIKDRLRQGHQRIRSQGADYLAYTLLDTIVDSYFVILDKMNFYLDDLEEKLINPPNFKIVQKIHHAKRDMISLRKAIWPMRDVVNQFLRLENIPISATTQLYLRDVYDHVVQTIDIIEGFRDVVASMMDIYLSSINIRTNDIMKVLTIVSTIFVPLTFIASIYGMNFEHMPELHTHWGYPFALLLMILTASGMLFFFHKKKWI